MCLTNLKSETWVEVLDKAITREKINDAIKGLKNTKSCGYDPICNEMIKCTSYTMSTALLKIYNHVLYSECFPFMWTDGYICPLFKKCDQMAPENYHVVKQKLPTFTLCI